MIVRCKNHASYAATKIRPIDALAGVGEQHLFNKLLDVAGIIFLNPKPAQTLVNGYRVVNTLDFSSHFHDVISESLPWFECW